MDENIKDLTDKWIIKADNDIKTAKQLLSAEEPITDVICFHSQQAVEKYLKLFIQIKIRKPDKIHSIAKLLQECIDYDSSFKTLTGIEYLSDYAVAARYPDDFYIPAIEEATEAYELSLKVKNFVLKKVK